MSRRWMEWWKRPGNAAMIFRSMRKMDEALWDAIPNSTNAEESMHWVLYRSVGKRCPPLEGIAGLVTFASSFEQMYEDEIST